MKRTFRTTLFLALILGACTTGVSSPESVPPATPAAPAALPTTAVPSNPQECAYQWAYQDLPELSGRLQQSIQVLQPEGQARTFAFGENCVHADGSADFIAMETDFEITLQATDLSNEAELGEWIVKVMEVIDDIPQAQIVGPRPGRVSIRFQSNGSEQLVSFYVDRYHALSTGLSNAEIYQALRITE